MKPQKEAEPWIELVRRHGEVAYVQADVTSHESMSEAVSSVEPLDIAIGNAGITRSSPFLNTAPEDWQAQIEVNLTGCFYFGQAAARAMVKSDRPGTILFVGSWIQEIPQPGNSAYSVSKAGVRMLARSMALELGEYRIRVNVLAPGIVDAGMAQRQALREPDFANRAARVIPLGERQTADQIAKSAVFLCSDEASATTGAVLLVDGGASLFKFN
jgi:NAD(P)-dependent dehydrogenase (short-subunit alcohol dehydrogenase family)